MSFNFPLSDLSQPASWTEGLYTLLKTEWILTVNKTTSLMPIAIIEMGDLRTER